MADDNKPLLDNVLTERGGTHGTFADNGYITGNLRSMFRASPNWNCLSPSQQLAMDEMALKQARILSTGSNNDHEEHWLDMAGYATMGWRDARSRNEARKQQPPDRVLSQQTSGLKPGGPVGKRR